ncbi:MAG: DUF6452 family protein [Bacteroidota bacterium]
MKLTTKILLLGLVIGFTSCLDDPDCISPTTDFATALFYKSESNERDTLEINSLMVLGKTDSILVSNASATGVVLPLRQDTTAVTFIFDSELGLDTLVITYETRSRLVSEECGIDIIIADLGYSVNTFDSVAVVNSTLIEDINEDIRIFN